MENIFVRDNIGSPTGEHEVGRGHWPIMVIAESERVMNHDYLKREEERHISALRWELRRLALVFRCEPTDASRERVVEQFHLVAAAEALRSAKDVSRVPVLV